MEADFQSWVPSSDVLLQAACSVPPALRLAVDCFSEGAASLCREGLERLSFLLPLLQPHLPGDGSLGASFFEAGISPTVAGKLTAALLWLDQISMTNPSDVLAALSQLPALFCTARSYVKGRLPAGGLSQLVHDNVTLELVVYSVGELCLFLIPLINREKLWAVASVVLRYARIWLLGVVASLCSPYNRLRAAMHRVRAENTASAGDETDGGQLCTACQQVPAVPYVANCSHTFCYSCVRSLSGATEDFPCPRCRLLVVYLQPASAEDPLPRGSSGAVVQ